MRTPTRIWLSILWGLPFIILFAAPAAAQDCNQCTPFSACGQSCERCLIFGQDYCEQSEASTCGEYGAPCMQCTPNFVETARDPRGTYGNGNWNSCSHHRVDWVTRSDQNQCNTDPYYWTVSTCEDTIDGGKSGWFPDCCNGYPNATYTCNHYHNC